MADEQKTFVPDAEFTVPKTMLVGAFCVLGLVIIAAAVIVALT